LIERNTTIPHKVSEVFTTAEDNQPSVEIHVLQGERDMAIYNKSLGRFGLVDLPMAARGIPKVEVIFDIDANGIVHVSARDLATGREQSMTITGQSSLSSGEIDRMVKDAKAHAQEDAARRAAADARNEADALVYHTERVLATSADSYLPTERSSIQSALADLRTALAGSDPVALTTASDQLTQASHAATQRLYADAVPSTEQAPPPPGSPSPLPPPTSTSPPPAPETWTTPPPV
jgi:molecular chaperone DnaK